MTGTSMREAVAAELAARVERAARGSRPVTVDVGDLYVQAGPMTLVALDGEQPEEPPADDLPAIVEIQSRTDRRLWRWTPDGLQLVFSRSDRRALSRLGFNPPEAELPNWWLLAEAGSRVSAARRVVDALVDVCGIPLEVVAADLGVARPGPGSRLGAPPGSAQHYALVDELDRDAVLDLLAYAPETADGGPAGWYRRTRSGWVNDPTVRRRLARKSGHRLRAIDADTARQVEQHLAFG